MSTSKLELSYLAGIFDGEGTALKLQKHFFLILVIGQSEGS